MTTCTRDVFAALINLMRFHGVEASVAQLEHEISGSPGEEVSELCRFASDHGFRTRVVSSQWSRLGRTPLPAIAFLRNGGALLLCGVREDSVLVQGDDGVLITLGRDVFAADWTGRLLLGRPIQGENPIFGFAWFFNALKKYRVITGQILLASAAVQLLGLASPLIFQVVIDRVLTNKGESTLDVMIVGLIIIALFEFFLNGFRSILVNHTSSRIDVELGMKLFRHLVGLPLAYFQSRRVGVIVARVRELDQIRQFLTSSALTMVIDAVFTLIFLAVMLLYSRLLTVIVFLSLPLYVGISIGVGPALKARVLRKFQTGAENQSFLVEAISGAETVKSLAAEPHMRRRWENGLASYVVASLHVVNLAAWASQWVTFVSKLSAATILFIGAKQVMGGHMTVGELVAFNMLAQRVAQPVLRMAQVWQDFYQARQSVQRIGDIMNTPLERPEGHAGVVLPVLSGKINLDSVVFRYSSSQRPVLNHLSLEIASGECVGIVGSSGSGKSTVTKLMQGVHAVESGRVTIGGFDVTAYDPAWLRVQVGVILQESFLFNGTILSNITAAYPLATLAEVMEAANLAGAHEFITELNGGYHTEIGERGTALSGGQKQRIAIARALLGNPRILIFDEATSALDYESESIIQDNMRRICEGRTVVIIAHRLSTVRSCDRIITIEKGSVVEQGCHEDLLSQNGRYAALYAVQSGLRVVA